MRTLITLACLAVLLLPAPLCAATYIAPIPPDAVVLRGTSPGQHYDIFLSKHTAKEIRDFYSAKLGPLASRTGSAYEAESPPVLRYQQVVDILNAHHGDLTLADDLRVSIRWKPVSNGQSQCAGDFFRELFAIAQIQKRQSELDALCKEYGYLQNAYFQRVPDPQRPGQWIDADRAILARAHEAHGGRQAQALGQSSAELGQRIAQLAMSGQSAEANALAAQLTQQGAQASGSVADWSAWVGVLKEGDALGYRTWVLLPTHPSTW